MIIDGSNKKQTDILTNKAFYQTTAQIMKEFEARGYENSADETAKVIAAYHDIVHKKTKNKFNSDYNDAFRKIDTTIQSLAHRIFYNCEGLGVNHAYKSFENFDYINAIVARQRVKRGF